MASDELRVPIGIPVETNASQAADSIQDLRDSLASSKNAIKETAAAMRDLRGDSDAVKAAKDQLRLKLEAEKSAVSASTLKLLEQSSGLAKVAEKTKGAEVATTKNAAALKKEKDAAKDASDAAKAKSAALSKAIGSAGGPVASLKSKLDGLKESLGGSEGGMAAVAGIAALAAAAIAAVGAAAIGAAVSLGKFIIASADAARMMQLTRKANLAGRDDWAKNLGEQVDALARKIPVTKEKLNELGISLAKSRIGGQTMVDTLEAVSGATAAAGDDLGNKLKGIVERGAFTRRFQLSPQELMGMDLDFTDVAKAYASGMHVSVERAREELFSGRVKLADGAKALKDAVNAKFGGINADKMLGLDNQLTKFKADLAGLAKDVNLKPLLEGIKKLADNFDQTSVNGKALKGIVTTIGNAIGVTFAEGVPVLQEFIDKAVWGALKIENYWLRAKIAFRETFGSKTTLEFVTFKAVLTSVVGALESMVPGLALVINGWDVLKASYDNVADGVSKVLAGIVSLKDAILGVDWGKAGGQIIDGLVGGLKSGAKRLLDTVKGLADDVKHAFTDPLRIHSPSKAFEEYGVALPAGAVKGVEKGAPRLTAAVDAMADVPAARDGKGGGGGARGNVTITLSPTIVVNGGGDIKAQLADPSLLQGLNEHLLAMLRAAGFGVAT